MEPVFRLNIGIEIFSKSVFCFVSDTGVQHYSCNQCPKMFKSLAALSAHNNIHLGKYKCLECGLCCACNAVLRRHMLTHNFGCAICKCSFRNRIFFGILCFFSFIAGFFGFPLRRYKCPLCPRTYGSVDALNGHRNIHLERYKCLICGLCCVSNSSLLKHKQTHEKKLQNRTNSYDGAGVTCPVCFKVYRHKASLTLHMNVHLQRFKCPHCGYCARTPFDLTEHIETHENLKYAFTLSVSSAVNHTTFFVKRLRCSICSKVYRNKPTMRLHMNVHEKKYQCPFCGYCSRTQFNLQEHIAFLLLCVLSNEYISELPILTCHVCDPVYGCIVCFKQFKSKESLRRHENIHLKRFKCPHCVFDKYFRTAYHLQRHISGHTKDIYND
uniref:C2H2-type domain-containing protein n=1 Tax=Strigamia maritima TaxID=126957 RepID=T1IP24_STRMM